MIKIFAFRKVLKCPFRSFRMASSVGDTEMKDAPETFGLEKLYQDRAEYSWLDQLQEDPDTTKYGAT